MAHVSVSLGFPWGDHPWQQKLAIDGLVGPILGGPSMA